MVQLVVEPQLTQEFVWGDVKSHEVIKLDFGKKKKNLNSESGQMYLLITVCKIRVRVTTGEIAGTKWCYEKGGG